MQTIRMWMILIAVSAVAASCGRAKFRKTPGGMPYQLFKGKSNDSIKTGYIIKYDAMFKINDSVVSNSFGHIPNYIVVDAKTQPYDMSELWTKLHPGDSIVTSQMMDTFIKRSNGQIDPRFKKGDKITSYIKILDVFKTDSLGREDYTKAVKAYTEGEVAVVAKYLADKKVNAQKTPSGAYVEIIKPGTGNLIDSGNYISVNYVGTTFAGKKFDSSVDSVFQHVGPMSFQVGVTPMAKGFDEGVRFLRMGSVGRIYVPSMLGYGPNPDPRSEIKPYDHLIFDITVIDVKDKAPEVNRKMLTPASPQPKN